MRNVFLASCVLAGAVFAYDTPPSAPPKAAAAPSAAKIATLDHIAVIGASISAGYGLDATGDMLSESKVQLANVIEASLNAPHRPVSNAATMMFFTAPQKYAKDSIALIAKEKPTLVVALDYLFWFGYGDGKEESRITKVDAALKDLETVSCTLLLGDLPDMTMATTVSQPMMQKNWVPAPETLKKINANITAWAAAHKNVVLVPLADLTAKLQGDTEITVHGNTWPKGSINRLMQADHLHTTLEGTCAVWALAADCLLKAQKDLPATSLELDVAKLMPKVGSPAHDGGATPPAGKDDKGAHKGKVKPGGGKPAPK